MNISNQFHTRRSLFKKYNIFESISHASSLFKKCKHLNSAFEENQETAGFKICASALSRFSTSDFFRTKRLFSNNKVGFDPTLLFEKSR